MSKTACWGTNRLDVEIANVYFGYGSRFDLSWYQLSLEALRVLVRYDYNYEHSYRSDVENMSWEEKYKESPMYIIFHGLSDVDCKKKAVEWFKSVISDNNKYNDPDLEFGISNLYPDRDIMGRIMKMGDTVESHVFGTRMNYKSVDMYLGGNSFYRSNFKDVGYGIRYYNEYQYQCYGCVLWKTLDDIVFLCLTYAKMLCLDAHIKYQEHDTPDNNLLYGMFNPGNERVLNVDEYDNIVKVYVTDGICRNTGLTIVFDKTKYKGWYLHQHEDN